MRRASLWGMALWGALAGAGLALVLSSLLGREPIARSDRAVSAPPPAANRAGVPKAHFMAHVRPLAEWDVDEPFDIAAGWRRAQALIGLSTLQLEGSLIRVLRSGHQFESKLALHLERTGDLELATLTLPRENGPSQIYRVELRDGVITRVRVGSKGPDGELQHTELPAAIQDGLDAGGLPIGIGDLSVWDAVALLHALRSGSWRLSGDLGATGSRRLIVFEIDLGREHEAIGQPPEAPGRAVSALAYVDAERWELHSLRAFDVRERLIRVYDGFAYQDSPEGSRLSGFRVSTIPTGSHTLFRLELMQLGD